MSKRTVLSLALALSLLAGCAPAADAPAPLPTADSPAPSSLPTAAPAHGDPAEFYAFLEGVNTALKSRLDQTEPIDLSPYTPDFSDQNHTFTQEELDLLFTYRGEAEGLTREDLLADADTFFTLLRTTYGAYHYFGGDETFLPIRDAVREELASAEAPTAKTLEDALMVGGPTTGCSLTPNNLALYLPRSSLGCYFGTGLSLGETGENIDGAGFLPDLWVEPVTALDAVKKLIEHYGLN